VILGRFLGWLLAAASLVVVGRDLASYWYEGDWTFVPMGELWAQLHPQSLVLLQPAIQGRLFSFYPELWDELFIPLLQVPAVAVLGGLAAILLLLFRRRRPRRTFR
jgi:hypothetical protein